MKNTAKVKCIATAASLQKKKHRPGESDAFTFYLSIIHYIDLNSHKQYETVTPSHKSLAFASFFDL